MTKVVLYFTDKVGMDREDFLDTLREQYAEEIQSAYLQCEHNKVIDYAALGKKLGTIMKTAKVDGLPEKEFEELVRTTLPDHSENIRIDSPFKKAA